MEDVTTPEPTEPEPDGDEPGGESSLEDRVATLERTVSYLVERGGHQEAIDKLEEPPPPPVNYAGHTAMG